MAESKPTILILGGSGFIGRHLVKHIFDNKIAEKICVADKVLHQIAGLNEEEKAIYSNKDFLLFKQVDLKVPDSVKKVFDEGDFKWVINLAAVTKYSQAEEVYDANIVKVSEVCAAEAAAHKVEHYVELSTCQVYKSKPKKPHTENGDINPWTNIGSASLAGEKHVQGTDGLNWTILRPAICYGTGDNLGLTPRLIIGAIYKETGKRMESLYDKGFKLSTVHVDDVARAIIWVCEKKDSIGKIYNVVDNNQTDQGKIHKLLEEVYGIKTSFVNSLLMKGASSFGAQSLASYANDKHLKPWSDACKKYHIGDTPLTPFLDVELIQDDQTNIDGSAIQNDGFKLQYPELKAEELQKVLVDFAGKGWFPKELC